MPELPEVETLVRRLREPLIGRTVEDVTIYWKRTIALPSPKEFARLLRGCTVQAIDRRAKYLVFTLVTHPSTAQRTHAERTLSDPEQREGEAKRKSKHARRSAHALSDAEHRGRAGRDASPPLFLLIHLKMSGKLSVVEKDTPLEKHDRVVFDLDDGQQLRFNDVRKFGRVWAVIDPEEVTGSIGPEPLDVDFNLPKFRALVKSRSGGIKPLLLNQTFLAGVGNIYADESLWRAKIHPLRKADTLSDGEIAALYRSIRQVLRAAIEDQGTDAGDGVIEGNYEPRVYGREGQPCYRCRRPIHRIVVGQRGTHFCPACQPQHRRQAK